MRSLTYNLCMRILYDGWPLAYAPLSPAATHLHELLAAAPATVERLLALPAAVASELPSGVHPLHLTPRNRGDWEQRALQALAAEHGAAAIHTTAAAAALLGKLPTLVSPAEYATEAAGRGRMAAAQAQGGLARARLLWPHDLPAPEREVHNLPPFAAPSPGAPANPAQEYLLYHGSGDAQVLAHLLNAWSWAAGSIGELYPLRIAGLDAKQQAWLEGQLAIRDLQDSVQLIHPSLAALPDVIQQCTAFLHPEVPPAWGSPLRQALAAGKAVVALQEPRCAAMAGAAAYLVPAGDARRLGAAIITLVVEEGLRATLEQQAAQKSASWDAGAFEAALDAAYQTLAA